MAKQTDAAVFVVAHLKAKLLPAPVSNASKIETHDLSKSGEGIDGGAVKPDSHPDIRCLEFPHHKLNVTPLFTMVIHSDAVVKRVNETKVEEWTIGSEGCDLLKSREFRNFDVPVVGVHGVEGGGEGILAEPESLTA